MEDFKSTPKMQCFKEGGSVKYESRKEHKEEVSKDIAKDKKIVKKAFKIHDTQSHEGEKTDLSKLKKGGRAKKEVGTVKKFKCGGGVFGAKKTKEDIKNMDAAKDCKPKKLCGGKSVRKMADGGALPMPGSTGTEQAALMGALPGKVNDLERMRMAARAKNAMKYLGPQQQNEFVQQGGMSTAPSAPVNQTARPFKNGGSITKCATGGSLKSVDAEDNPGLSKLPTEIRNKMGYMRKGGKAKKMNTGGTCS